MAFSPIPSDVQPAAEAAVARVPERQRTRPRSYRKAARLSLLRKSATKGSWVSSSDMQTAAPADQPQTEETAGDASRGIARGLLLVAPFWAAVGVLIWRLL